MKVKNIVYEQSGAPEHYLVDFPCNKGWYIQKRIYISGNPAPVLLKLQTFLTKITALVYNIYTNKKLK